MKTIQLRFYSNMAWKWFLPHYYCKVFWVLSVYSFHLLRLHFITHSSWKMKTSNIKAELVFWPILDDCWKQWGFCASPSPLCSPLWSPHFGNSLHPKASIAFGEMYIFKRHFHAKSQKLHVTFLSKTTMLRAFWISLPC